MKPTARSVKGTGRPAPGLPKAAGQELHRNSVLPARLTVGEFTEQPIRPQKLGIPSPAGIPDGVLDQTLARENHLGSQLARRVGLRVNVDVVSSGQKAGDLLRGEVGFQSEIPRLIAWIGNMFKTKTTGPVAWAKDCPGCG